MYIYGIAYYEMDDSERVPISGLDVRLVRPGDDFGNGIQMYEMAVGSGYYECDIATEADCGLYEIWDDQNNPLGAFSGKTCIVGKLDARGIQNANVYSNHIQAGAVGSTKIADHAVGLNHLDVSLEMPITMLLHEVQTHADGVGNTTAKTPPESDDQMITHVFAREYAEAPTVLLTATSPISLYMVDVAVDDGVLTVVIGVLSNPAPVMPEYSIMAFAR